MQKRRGLQKAVKQLTSWKDSPPQCRQPHSSNLMLPIPPHSSEPGLSLTFKIITNFHFNKAISDQKLRCKRGYPCQPQTLPLSCRSPRQGCTLQGDFLGVIPKWLTWPLIVTEIHLLRLQSFNQRIPLFPEQQLVFLLLTTPLICAGFELYQSCFVGLFNNFLVCLYWTIQKKNNNYQETLVQRKAFDSPLRPTSHYQL